MMKKIVCSLFAVAALSSGVAFAAVNNNPGTGVIGTSHDMRQYAGITDVQNRVCAFCHTPHHAFLVGDQQYTGQITQNTTYFPLWSHAITQQSYSPYGTGLITPFNNSGGKSMNTSDPLIGDSRLCMSCHDGVTAVNAYYQAAISGPSAPVVILSSGTQFGNPVIEHDLNRTHPIGFNMLAVLPVTGTDNKNPGLKQITPTTLYTGNANANVTILSRLFGNDGTVAANSVGILTCSSCHDVHNTLNKGIVTTGGDGYFLLGSQDGSGICISCHTQGTGL